MKDLDIIIKSKADGLSCAYELYDGTPADDHLSDHPDDCHSISNPRYPNPWLIDTESNIGILLSGWGEGLGHLLGGYNTSTALVKPDLTILAEPEKDLNDLSVLLIGSAGLTGYDNSPTFRSKLANFVENGGTLIAFTSQHGYEFNALPGGELSGYGWLEDQSCHYSSVGITTYHPILSGQDSVTSDANVDGYFTKYPMNATILLSRTKNGQPAMLMYEYGNGTVIATTAYTDWAYGHGQATRDEKNLVRDMIAWAKDPKDIQNYGAGDIIYIPIEITNNVKVTADNVSFTVIDPDKNIFDHVNVSTTILPNETKTINFTYIAPSKLGIWWIDYSLLNNSNVTQTMYEAERFAVSKYAENPEGWVYQGSELSFDVTTPDEYVVFGSEVTFFIHIYNNGDVDKNISVKKDWSHWVMDWEKVSVPAHDMGTITHTMKASSGRFWAWFYDGDTFLGHASKGICSVRPSIYINIETDKQEYVQGEDVSILLNLGKYEELHHSIAVTVRLLDPDNNKISEEIFAFTSGNKTLNFTLPIDSERGICTVTAEAYSNNNKIGSGSTYFELKDYPLKVNFDKPDKAYRIRENMSIDLEITNTGSALWSSEINISIPSLSFGDSNDVSLNQNETKKFSYNLNIPETTPAGKHDVIVTLGVDNSTKKYSFVIPNSKLVLGSEKTSYNAGDNLSINLTNNGGVDTTYNCSIKFYHAVLIYENETVQESILAGECKSILFKIPDQAVSGVYYLMVECKDMNTGMIARLAKTYDVRGLKAALTSRSDKKVYFVDENISILTNISNLDGVIENATLDFNIFSPSSDYKLLLTWGTSGSGNGDFNNPVDIAIDKYGHIYVADAGNYRIQRFDSNGNFITKWGSYGAGNGQFRNLRSIDVDLEGNVYTLDCARVGHDFQWNWNCYVQKFDNTGTFITKWQSNIPWSMATTHIDSDLAVDNDGYVYVTHYWDIHAQWEHAEQTWIKKYDSNGAYLMPFGEHGNHYSPSHDFIAVNDIFVYTDYGYGFGSESGDTIEIFDHNGTFIDDWIVSGDITSIAVDNIGFIYLAIHENDGNYRIKKFSGDGNLKTAWGSYGTGNGQFDNPTLDVDNNENIYVADGGNNRIQKFVPSRWNKNMTFDVIDTRNISTNVGLLNITGKFTLLATLYSNTSQIISQDEVCFYITDKNTSLTLETDKRVYKPNETIKIYGEVKNNAIADDYNLSITKEGEDIFSDTFTLSSGESYNFNITTTSSTSFTLKGTANDVVVTDFVKIEPPTINVSVIAPDVVGLEDFDILAMIKNIGNVTADLKVSIENTTWNISIPEKESKLIETTMNITRNTTLVVNISGDVNQIIQREIICGENAKIKITPKPTYLEGIVEIPYTIENLGILDSTFNATFSIDDQTVLKGFFVPKGENITDSISFNLSKGAHLLKYTSPFEEVNETINVLSPPAFIVTSIRPEDMNFTLGQNVTLSFIVKNIGGTEGEATLRLLMPDFEDTNRTWIRPGEKEDISFSFIISDDLEEKSYKGIYELEGERGEFAFFVQGAKISVNASLDKNLYEEGETASFILEVTNECPFDLSLYARVQLGDYEEMKHFNLTDFETLQFDVPVHFNGQKLFYGIYMESGRALYLNAMYVHKKEIMTLYTDKQVYNAGENVTVFVDSTKSGTLNITAPGFNTSIFITGSTVLEFSLPKEMRSGTYYIDYAFDNFSSAYPFDVIGYSVRILECSLDKEVYNQSDVVKVRMNVEANQNISGVLKLWIYDSENNLIDAFEINREFVEGENEIEVSRDISTNLSGIHVLVYGIYAHSDVIFLASGAEYFDVKGINVPPIADANGPYTGIEGSPITFDGSGSYDPDGTIVSYEWDLDDDGEFDDATGATPTKTWDAPYSGNISLRVTDDEGATDINSTSLAIVPLNVPPVADADGPYVADEGSTITFNGSGSYDPNDDIVSWLWDLDGDGIYEANATETTGTVNYTWCDDYFGNVSLRVTDSFGATDLDNTTVAVLNVPPTADAGSDQTIYAGDMVIFNGSATDPGCDDLKFEWKFGDGANATGLNATHSYFDQGHYTVTFSIIDDDGGVGTDTTIITVNPIPASVTIKPETLNLKSRGIFIAFIRLPKGYHAAHINSKTVVCEGAPALGGFGFHNTFIAWFNIQKLVDVPTGDAVTLTVIGKVFYNGGKAGFEGSDTIRVIDKGKRK